MSGRAGGALQHDVRRWANTRAHLIGPPGTDKAVGRAGLVVAMGAGVREKYIFSSPPFVVFVCLYARVCVCCVVCVLCVNACVLCVVVFCPVIQCLVFRAQSELRVRGGQTM